jgi:hypothetical protein
MRTPLNKLKKADRALMAAILFCFFVAFAIFTFVLRAYLKDELWVNTQTKPASVDLYDSLFVVAHVLVYWLFPIFAAGFLLVGCIIWNYRRKRGAIEDYVNPDA